MYVRNQFMGVTLLFACIQVTLLSQTAWITSIKRRLKLVSINFWALTLKHTRRTHLLLALQVYFKCLYLRFLISLPSILFLGRGPLSLGSASKMSASSWLSSGKSSALDVLFHFSQPASSFLDLASASQLQINRLVFLTKSMTRNKTHMAPPRRNSSSMQLKPRLLIPQRWWKFSSLPCSGSRIMRMQQSRSLSCPGLRCLSR